MELPLAFCEGVRMERGWEADAWLQALPGRVERACEEWGLERDLGLPWHGHVGVVFPVLRAGRRLALKVSWVDQETQGEAEALRRWGGQGAVQLVESREGLLLLERLAPDRCLNALPIVEATAVAAGLLRRLSVPFAGEVPEAREYARRQAGCLRARWQAAGEPGPPRWLKRAEGCAAELSRRSGDLLIHSDLHYENVLAGEREPWLAIDPKPVLGEPEFGVAPLLWNRFGEDLIATRFDALVGRAGVDRERAVAWSLLRCLDYWLWALERQLSVDSGSCRSLVEWLAMA